jgi:hypothetical protein
LQYRGVFWTQINGKDWTVNAFLRAIKGGLGLDVAQDNATQEALKRILEAGLLLGRTVEELQGRQINAAFLAAVAPRILPSARKPTCADGRREASHAAGNLDHRCRNGEGSSQPATRCSGLIQANEMVGDSVAAARMDSGRSKSKNRLDA